MIKRKASANSTSLISLTLTASLIYAVSGGIRSNYGILLRPITENSGVGYSAVSFVLAIAQLSFGIMQPCFGLLTIKKSDVFVLRTGIILTAGGLLLLPFCKALIPLLIVLGILLPSGTAALAFGTVMGAITPKLPSKTVSAVSGIVSASCGVGSTILSPLIQMLTVAAGLYGTVLFLGIPTLLLFPAALYMCSSDQASAKKQLTQPMDQKNLRFKTMMINAFQNRNYLYLLLGFFTCGFHMVMIETHLYTQIITYGFTGHTAALAFSAYGMASIAGCVLSGFLCSRIPMKCVLGGLYGLRCFMVLGFLFVPKTVFSIYGFVILLGLTGNATVPPVSGLTEQIFGAAKLSTLFGVAFLFHQIGGFLSSWLGGICLIFTGGYQFIWLADIFLSLIASYVSFIIKSKQIERITFYETQDTETICR